MLLDRQYLDVPNPYVYVISDFTKEIVEFCQKHKRMEDHIKKGVVDFAVFSNSFLLQTENSAPYVAFIWSLYSDLGYLLKNSYFMCPTYTQTKLLTICLTYPRRS